MDFTKARKWQVVRFCKEHRLNDADLRQIAEMVLSKMPVSAVKYLWAKTDKRNGTIVEFHLDLGQALTITRLLAVKHNFHNYDNWWNKV